MIGVYLKEDRTGSWEVIRHGVGWGHRIVSWLVPLSSREAAEEWIEKQNQRRSKRRRMVVTEHSGTCCRLTR